MHGSGGSGVPGASAPEWYGGGVKVMRCCDVTELFDLIRNGLVTSTAGSLSRYSLITARAAHLGAYPDLQGAIKCRSSFIVPTGRGSRSLQIIKKLTKVTVHNKLPKYRKWWPSCASVGLLSSRGRRRFLALDAQGVAAPGAAPELPRGHEAAPTARLLQQLPVAKGGARPASHLQPSQGVGQGHSARG